MSGAVEACKKPCEVEKTSRNKCDTRCYSAIFLIIIMIDPCSAQGDMTMTSILQRVESRLIFVGHLTGGGGGKCVN